ncbi:hypothetical protein SPRG_19918 [Saprolegnia parasitica CBS 223.65]|nr:hypothetical protein SPRG_19918 [Saprolegnia parasitica CBS 223.65]KDO29255.1 hypothetical protein SPRG_19918 [Saprolegnia parasitica CBS 223.65]|eukprot:XP_012200145.1 hypothetical protein SPRG_19918 [Saprolegnia parasitica CBS 223.65]
MARKINWAGVGLSVITGTSLAAVSIMAYFRFEFPEQFAEGSVRQSRPEAWTDEERQWGAFGSGLADAIPSAVTNVFRFENVAERIEARRAKRRQEIQDIINQKD